MFARWFILMALIWFPTISWADFPQEIEETNTPQVQLFSVEQSSYQAFRAEITLHTDLASLLLLFQDVPKQSQWIYRCKEASILKKKTNLNTSFIMC